MSALNAQYNDYCLKPERTCGIAQGLRGDFLTSDEVRAVEHALATGTDADLDHAAELILGQKGPAALTVKQPWARALNWGIKDVENRGYVFVATTSLFACCRNPLGWRNVGCQSAFHPPCGAQPLCVLTLPYVF